MLADQSQREKALNPKASFIVKAPAGSGKTYLLTRRILNLLLTVEDPSHVISITFTKKAASEMRERVHQCLIDAKEPIALDVLKRSESKGWNILENIDDLSIMTLDAFSAWLLSYGKPKALPKVSQNPFHIYTSVIFSYYQKPEYSESQYILLSAFKAYKPLEGLLSSLLSQRDQWQSPLSSENLSQSCQKGLQAIISHAVENLILELKPIEKKIAHLFNLHQTIARSHDASVLFDPKTDLERLQNLATLCLTTTGTLRKTLNKNQGLYPKAKISQATLDLQTEFVSYHETIQDYLLEHNLLESLSDIHKLPHLQDETEQAFLKALSEVLSDLTERLDHQFQVQKTCDFIHIALDSIQSLQNDPILQDFCRSNIHHLLVDEFQDTSLSQYQLLESILSLWPQNEPRTLFLVGDPMQSIYRFRQADLSIFLRLQSQPIAHIQLTPLELVSNFRSSEKLIDMINDLFPEIFPKTPSAFYGGIPYSQAATTQPGKPEDTCYLHLETSDDPKAQAQHTLSVLQDLLSQYPKDSIAILVQARSHLKHIIPLLEHHRLAFNAIDIYPTLSLSAISDLSALLGALVDPYDRLSLYTVLRSPLCGLSLDLLDTLPKDQHNLNILKTDLDDPYFKKFSQVWIESLQEPNPIYQTFQIFESLKGPNLYPKNQAIAIENWFSETLARFQEGLSLDRLSLQDHFSKSYNSIINPDAQIYLLTSHKSKGLEYDHVIIPHTEKKKPPASLPLFYCEQGEHPIIQPTFTESSQNIEYFKYLQKRRDQYENLRLLYVACTRAKKTLHFVGHENTNSNTWLSCLYPLLQPHPRAVILEKEHEALSLTEDNAPLIRTLDHEIIERLPKTQKVHSEASDLGTALHYFMQCFRSTNRDHKWRYYLHRNNLDPKRLEPLVQTILTQSQKPTFQWIMKAYSFERNEFSLVYQHEHLIIDRVFLDQDTLWIIDYKFPTQSLSSNTLLNQYQDQLIRYQKALSQKMPGYPIRMALYLPLENRWLELVMATSDM